jgi:predicted small lipoprotein YifL
MYMSKIVQFILLVMVVISASGCGTKEMLGFGGKDKNAYDGPEYPATSKVATAFQPTQVPKSCRVFAEVLVQLPPKISGKNIENTILAEAGKRGADQVLIGQGRQGESDDGVQFLYYGPKKEYLCSEQWSGWKFGYNLWEKQGEWVSVGYKEWGKAEVSYETPLVLQMAMLRCQ